MEEEVVVVIMISDSRSDQRFSAVFAKQVGHNEYQINDNVPTTAQPYKNGDLVHCEGKVGVGCYPVVKNKITRAELRNTGEK
jgi:hypothetical protein